MIDVDERRRVLVAPPVDGADAISADVLRAPRKRKVGAVPDRHNYQEARAKIVAGVAYLLTRVEPERGDPSGTEAPGPFTDNSREPRNAKPVGARGFEPPTPWSRTRCATRLRYAPHADGKSSLCGAHDARSPPPCQGIRVGPG